MSKRYFIFFTGEIDTKDSGYLSFSAKDKEKLFEDIEKNVYCNENENLIFYNSRIFFENKKGTPVDLAKQIIDKLKLDKSAEFYIFFHGSEIEGNTTKFSEQDDLAETIKKEAGLENVSAFYFTHTKGDIIYNLLVNYQDALASEDKSLSLNEQVFNYLEFFID